MESSISVWNKCYGKQEHLKETSSDDNHQEVLYRVILTVFGSVAVLLLSLILLVGVFVSLEAGYSTTGYYNKFVQQFSIPCDDLSLSPDEDFNLFNINRHKFTYSVHNDVYICTFRNVTEVIFIFVQRIGRLRLSQGLESQPYLQCGNSTLKPASGHLTATFSKVSRHHTYKEKSSDTSRQWKVSLRMCVSSGEHERTLLYRSKVFSTSETDIVSSLNVGSHVFLAKEEDVYVKISNAEGLIHDSDGNSFGIFPMY
ncbi:uncharacterized protein LOC123554728 isoform X2 [Mercenaria mercenaria]|uniref:uncharacterized protein LOC123554728 isoform X2 n=1 Tax=Mercenaria mercenaria TaxID=6596 RepID=UPI00234F0013|nr:uncharacterized protein LOC123554728 isoform X2 [Mercenaria mercenaria]